MLPAALFVSAPNWKHTNAHRQVNGHSADVRNGMPCSYEKEQTGNGDVAASLTGRRGRSQTESTGWVAPFLQNPENTGLSGVVRETCFNKPFGVRWVPVLIVEGQGWTYGEE